MKKSLLIFCPFFISAMHCGQTNMIYNCVRCGNVPGLENALIQSTREINTPGEDEEPPLHWAAIIGNTEMVELLLKNDANPNQLDKDNDTPLHSAAIGGNKRIAELLIQYGADTTVNHVDIHGYVALHSAAFHNNTDVIEVLLAHNGKK